MLYFGLEPRAGGFERAALSEKSALTDSYNFINIMFGTESEQTISVKGASCSSNQPVKLQILSKENRDDIHFSRSSVGVGCVSIL
jgi:hypothetical protein